MADPTRGTGATVTVLKNGDLLVVGGDPGMQVTSCSAATPDVGQTAEIYSSATATWRLTSPPSTGRQLHTATLLPDGRVLVTGGLGAFYGQNGECPQQSSAEIYDPASDRWTVVAPMHVPRANHVAALLPDGRVLVAGGLSLSSSLSAEIYNPRTNKWTSATPPPQPLDDGQRAAALLLSTGQVVVAGIGEAGADGGLDLVAELYDPQTDSWKESPPPPNPHENTGLLLLPLPSGRVLFSLNIQFDTGAPPTFETINVLDPITDEWTSTGPEGSPHLKSA